MANIVKQRAMSIAGSVPDSATVEFGELILNFADGRLYFKSPDGSMSWISGKAELGRVARWNGRNGDVMPEANDYGADAISFEPQPGLLASNVQDAIDFLLELKADIDHKHSWSAITGKPSLFPSTWGQISNKPNFSPLAYLQLPGSKSLSLLGDGSWGQPKAKVQWSDVQDKPKFFPSAPVPKAQIIWGQILEKPTAFPTNWGQVQDKPIFGSLSQLDLSLDGDTVLSGDGTWTTISTLVELQQTSWGQINDKPTTFPSSWGAIQGKPDFGTIAQVNLSGNVQNVLFGDGTWGPMLLSGSVSWTNVLDKPSSFPSTWADVQDKPLFGTVSLIDLSGTDTTVLRGDGTWGAPPATGASVSWASIQNKPTFGTVSAIDLDGNPNRFLSGQGSFGPISWTQVANKPTFGSLSSISTNGNPATFLNGNGLYTTIQVSWTDVQGKPPFGTASLITLNGDPSAALRGDGTWQSVLSSQVLWSSIQQRPTWTTGSNGDSTVYLRGDLTYGKVAWADIQGIDISWSQISNKPTFGNLSTIDVRGSISTPQPASATYFLNGNGEWIELLPLTANSIIDGGTY